SLSSSRSHPLASAFTLSLHDALPIFIVAACWVLNRPPILRHWLLTDLRPWCLDQWERIGFVGVAFAALAAFYLMLAIHELGHVADRKSTRLNSSHGSISYAVFCLKKK